MSIFDQNLPKSYNSVVNTKYMSTVRITLTPELEKAVQILEKDYVGLNRVEIFKLGISKLFKEKEDIKSFRQKVAEWSATLPVYTPKGKELKSLKKALKEVEEGKVIGPFNIEEALDYLDKI